MDGRSRTRIDVPPLVTAALVAGAEELLPDGAAVPFAQPRLVDPISTFPL